MKPILITLSAVLLTLCCSPSVEEHRVKLANETALEINYGDGHEDEYPTKLMILCVKDMEYFEDYPHMMEGLTQAIKAWEAAIPVKFLLTNDPDKADIGFVITDIQNISGVPANLLGFWNGRAIFMDDTMEDGFPDDNYFTGSHVGNVIAHEIGHAFGIPHIVPVENSAGKKFPFEQSGAILMRTEREAMNYLMYPTSRDDTLPKGISQLEADIARLHLKIPASW